MPTQAEPPAVDLLEATVRATVVEWNAAHREHDRKRLEALYDTPVRVGRLTLPRDAVLRLKEAEFQRSPSSVPIVLDVQLDRTTPGLPKARVVRELRTRNRIASSEVTLTLSCDKVSCLVVAEVDDAWSTSGSRAATLQSRPGSCAEALTRLLGTVPDARQLLAGRAPERTFVALSAPPEATVYRFALSAVGASETTPAALYELAPGTLKIREALPGDVDQTGSDAAAEQAKRACASR